MYVYVYTHTYMYAHARTNTQAIGGGPKDVPGYTMEDAIFLTNTFSTAAAFCVAWFCLGTLSGIFKVCECVCMYVCMVIFQYLLCMFIHVWICVCVVFSCCFLCCVVLSGSIIWNIWNI
jgi:hypothetical protein